ncbi:pyrroloquinoline quinone biosynthesis protein B [Haladaptatus litoreus]|uniref:Pyrroloquinoline quinone biosynthesis protein B n=1 Tax=Haladaptatus litoreus TaxID=553468 RepID=A0A1N6X757_9EURY|nr:MBL fold metallo-hydrolase [Haladaptatus litoreus]SIQ98155.1 pyrroloquinoline quinone biosynthesis protein B [Haladaptatus litoreus]
MRIRVLGTAQDEGIPRLDCECNQCSAGIVRHGPAIAVESNEKTILVDAPPDVKQTIGLTTVDCILLTHAHVGHYGGLFYFGREGYDAERKPLHCSERMATWLRDGNKAYHHLVARENVELCPFVPDEPFELGGLTCHPISVPHRNEDADTVGFRFEENDSSLTYIPDIDYWTQKAERAVRKSDIALVDGTFYSMAEVGGRNVPHPTIPETMERFEGCETDLYFTHLNHTNPVADSSTPEYRTVVERGFEVVSDLQVFSLKYV